jgi:hypothetical protein
MEQNNLLSAILGNQSLLESLVNLVVIILPMVITYYLRNYVKSTQDEKRVALMTQLASTAIGYVEDLDHNGQLDKILQSLNLPETVIQSTSQGFKKLNAATKVLQAELDKRGITITTEEAQGVIRGEFQKLTGQLGVERDIFVRTQEAIALLKDLQQTGLVNLPDDVEQLTQLSGRLVDWAVLQLDQRQENANRQAALALAQTGLLVNQPLQSNNSAILPETRLTQIAQQVVGQVNNLKTTLAPGITETEIVISWVLTEALKQGLQVSPEEINKTVQKAFQWQAVPSANSRINNLTKEAQ